MISPEYAVAPRRAPPSESGHEPLPGKVAVVTSYFNPCSYRLRRSHYDRFAENLQQQEVDLFTAELTLRDQPRALIGYPKVLAFNSDHVLWHKERLLNLLIRTLPPEYDKIAWVDADVHFLATDWPQQLAETLERFPVVQLFDRAIDLDPHDQPAKARPGVAFAAASGSPHASNLGRSHPGFAWAARRELLRQHELLDNHILGGADSIMVCSMYGWWTHPLVASYGHTALREAMLRWGYEWFRSVQGRVGFLSTPLLHFWHGDRHRRRYVERVGWLARARFDPVVDLELDRQGLWKWRDSTSWLARRVEQYFDERREDG